MKQGNQSQLPRMTVYLPPEMEQAVYADFVTLARNAVEEATKSVVKNDRYLNQKQLAEYFKCGVGVIADWRAMGLKSFMKGKQVMFDMEDVTQFLDKLKN